MRINVGGAMHAKNIQSPMFNDGQIHIAKWVRNALDLNDGDELLFEVVDNKIIFTKAGASGKIVSVKCSGGLKVTRENERIPPYRT